MSFYVSTGTFVLLHCDEWDRVVALPRHKFVTGATLLQLGGELWWKFEIKTQDRTLSKTNNPGLVFRLWKKNSRAAIVKKKIWLWSSSELISNGDLFQPHLKYTLTFFHSSVHFIPVLVKGLYQTESYS